MFEQLLPRVYLVLFRVL